MNKVWLSMLVTALAFSLWGGRLPQLPQAAMDAMAQGIELSLTMAGAYMLWMGILAIAQQSGLNKHLAKGLRRLLAPLFPSARNDAPAMEAISMNLAANAFGMGAAATPLGIKAMEHLKRLAPGKAASDDMILFLVLNTSSVLLIPTSVIALRLAAGSSDAYSVTLPIILCGLLMTAVGILWAGLLRRIK